MPRMLKYAVALTAVIGALAPANALAAPPPGMSLSTSCAHPGETVTVNTEFWSGPAGASYWWRLTASDAGITVASTLPTYLGQYDPFITTQFTVPLFAPWTTYDIWMGIGSLPFTSEYGSFSAPLTVSPWC